MELRERDINCALIGSIILSIFVAAIIISAGYNRADLIPDLLSSVVIAELTLTLIWLELGKRAELTLRGILPILYYSSHLPFPKNYSDLTARYDITSPCVYFKEIREAKFDRNIGERLDDFSFRIYVANMGQEEITVHEFVTILDESRPSMTQLLTEDGKPITLKCQQRHTISIPYLGLKKTGFHKLWISVYTATSGVGTEIWFNLSEDFSTVRFIRIVPLHHLFGRFIKSRLTIKEKRKSKKNIIPKQAIEAETIQNKK